MLSRVVLAAASGVVSGRDPCKRPTVLTAAGNDTYVWDAESGELIHEFAQDVRWSSNGGAFYIQTSDLNYIVSLWGNSSILWDAASFHEAKRFVIDGQYESVRGLQFNPARDRVLIPTSSQQITIWDFATTTQLVTLYQEAYVFGATYNRKGDKIMSWDDAGNVILWNAANGTKLLLLSHSNMVSTAAFAANDARIISSSWDHTAIVWDASTGEKLQTYQHDNPVHQAYFNRKGDRILTVAGPEFSCAIVWDTTSVTEIQRRCFPGSTIFSAIFTPDESGVVTALAEQGPQQQDQGRAVHWDITTGQELMNYTHEHGRVVQVSFDSMGHLLTAADDTTAGLWNFTSGERLQTYRHDLPDKVLAVFSASFGCADIRSSEATFV